MARPAGPGSGGPGSAGAGPAGYDVTQYPAFAVTVDVVVLAMDDGVMKVLLVQRRGEPFAGSWALPGGFKTPDETLDEAAARELLEETGVAAPADLSAPAALVQVGAYGDPGRDPRTNVVTVVYRAALAAAPAPRAGTDAAEAWWFPVAEVLAGTTELAFDHHRIVTDAVERTSAELESSAVALAFVPREFTLTQLRRVYDQLWGTELDAGNFRRSLKIGVEDYVRGTAALVEPSSEGGRPGELFRAGDRELWRAAAPVRRSRQSARKA